jgi:hypothetical protein
MKRIVSLLPLALILGITAVTASALMKDQIHHTGSAHPKPPSKQVAKQLRAAKLAAAKFRDPEAAKAAGYTPTDECVATKDGTMGQHWANVPLLADPKLDPAKPEILLYVPTRNGGRKLVAVEWFQLNQSPPTQPTPKLFGERFDGPMTHNGTAPSHFDLHVWVFAKNPRGVFAQYNPAVSC